MTSNGQRFRRRSLRRGYKVDEVDLFLDRVEATLNGESAQSPVRSQEVHDVVFRVRFGGYDEWQVDLHLDRVERQLADQEGTQGGARVPQRTTVDRVPERIASERLPDRMQERAGMPPSTAPLPTRSPMGSGIAGAGPATASGYPSAYNDPSAYNEQTYVSPGANRPMPPTNAPQSGPAGAGGHGGPQGPAGYDPSRHGRMDMTAEMRMPDVRSAPPAAPPSMPPHAAPPSAPPHADRTSGMPSRTSGLPSREPSAPPSTMGPIGGPAGHGPANGMGSQPMSGGGTGPASPGDVQRIDQMRRAFQPRRFGSGYDRAEVDRLFEGVIAAMTGRSSMPTDSDLDPGRFNLVPGGYFEAEVDQALREVRDIFRRR